MKLYLFVVSENSEDGSPVRVFPHGGAQQCMSLGKRHVDSTVRFGVVSVQLELGLTIDDLQKDRHGREKRQKRPRGWCVRMEEEAA